MLVDYVKHSFVSKFNRLHSDLYGTFTTILSHDVLAVRARLGETLDPTHSCVKRLGLASLPLTVVTHRMLLLRFGSPEGAPAALSVRAAAAAAAGQHAATGSAAALDALLDTAAYLTSNNEKTTEGGAMLATNGGGWLARAITLLPPLDSALPLFLGFLCLLAIKACLGIGLVGAAARTIASHRTALAKSEGGVHKEKEGGGIAAAAAGAMAAKTPKKVGNKRGKTTSLMTTPMTLPKAMAIAPILTTLPVASALATPLLELAAVGICDDGEDDVEDDDEDDVEEDDGNANTDDKEDDGASITSGSSATSSSAASVKSVDSAAGTAQRMDASLGVTSLGPENLLSRLTRTLRYDLQRGRMPL